VLLIHGENDENVSIEHARMIEDKLKEAGKPVESGILPCLHPFRQPPDNASIFLRRKIMRKTAVILDEDTVRCLIYDMIIKNKRMKGDFHFGNAC
jgi:acetyl esterase/lipase